MMWGDELDAHRAPFREPQVRLGVRIKLTRRARFIVSLGIWLAGIVEGIALVSGHYVICAWAGGAALYALAWLCW